jgi:hypothetical protein
VFIALDIAKELCFVFSQISVFFADLCFQTFHKPVGIVDPAGSEIISGLGFLSVINFGSESKLSFVSN